MSHRNTLNRSVVNHIPPGYLSPRSNPDLAGFVEENHIYCDPAEESGEEEEEHLYKVPRLSSSSEVPKVNGVSQPSRQSSIKHGDSETGASRSGSASSAVSQDGARRGSANSQMSVESPKPLSPALQSNTHSSASEREHVCEESPKETQTVYETVDEAKGQDLSAKPIQSTQNQAKDRGQSNRNSGKKLPSLPKLPPPTKPKPQQSHQEKDVYESMDSGTNNQVTTITAINSSTPTRKSKIEKRESHSVDDYEDIDAELNGPQTPLLPALDDYVDMAVGNHDNTYISPEYLKRTGSHEELLERLKSTSSASSAPATPSSKPGEGGAHNMSAMPNVSDSVSVIRLFITNVLLTTKDSSGKI